MNPVLLNTLINLLKNKQPCVSKQNKNTGVCDIAFDGHNSPFI